MGLEVSVIIICDDNPQAAAACVESVVKSTHEMNYEIILVDNGSTPVSKNYLESNLLFIPQLTILYSEKNLGLG